MRNQNPRAHASEGELAKLAEFLKAENQILRSKLPRQIYVSPTETFGSQTHDCHDDSVATSFCTRQQTAATEVAAVFLRTSSD